MYIVEVYVTNASLKVNQTFSYCHDAPIESYRRVLVNFGGRETHGIVINSHSQDQDDIHNFRLKPVIEVVDDEPILNNEQFELAKWLSYSTVSPFISCLNAMLPKPLRTSSSLKNPRIIQYIRKDQVSIDTLVLTDKQKEILSRIEDRMPLAQARKLSCSIVNKLIEKGALKIYEDEKKYSDIGIMEKASHKLNDEQRSAVNNFLNDDHLVSLLYGVTGSGKTEVYLTLASEYLKNEKDVLILVPEISLTPMMIDRVRKRFNDVIFYHSDLNDQERYEQYQRVKEGKVHIVVGTRSAVFLPFKDLGLIIIDEEHDQSYKQEITPCYNARNVAIKRAYDHKARVLLATATPSLESYSRSLKGEYGLLKLQQRFNMTVPEIELINYDREYRYSIIPKKLQEALSNTISNGQQAMILLNRRGYSSLVRCSSCNTILMCKDCDCALTYHKDENLLKCHQCSKIYRLPELCPTCNSRSLVYQGYGTKKVEEEIQRIFPNIKTLRMDKDSTSRKNSHQMILKAFERQEANVLVGTQMIAKGLDFENVTLVGILNGDSGLFHQDYNSAKITFDLLMQASGRSGRSSKPGKVMIQTSNPDHYAVKAVLLRDYEYFFRVEMNYRSLTHYPPYAHMIEFVLSDTNIDRLNRSSDLVKDLLKDSNIRFYDPLDLPKLKGLYRKRLLLSDRSMAALLAESHDVINKYLKERNVSGVRIDPDPISLE